MYYNTRWTCHNYAFDIIVSVSSIMFRLIILHYVMYNVTMVMSLHHPKEKENQRKEKIKIKLRKIDKKKRKSK